MKRTKLIVISVVILLFLLIAFLVLNYEKASSNDNNSWSSYVPIPFSGFICGYEETDTFMQLPFLLSKDKNVEISEIMKIELVSNLNNLSCKNFSLSEPRRNEEYGYELITLSFRVEFPTSGVYEVDGINIYLQNEEVICRNLGSIIFVSEVFKEKNHSFEIYDSYKVEYTNNSDKIIEILGLDYPNTIATTLTMEAYYRFSADERQSNNIIPPNSSRSFIFKIAPVNEYFNNNKYFYMLPMVRYLYNGLEYTMPFQTQATIIQPPIKPEEALQLLKSVGDN